MNIDQVFSKDKVTQFW